MTAPTLWSPGTQIVLHEVWRDRLWSARPMTVVEDQGDFVALWCPKASVRKVPTTPPSRPRPDRRLERLMDCLTLEHWVFVDNAWDVNTLWLMHEGQTHAVWASWLDDAHWGWYINLQEPFRRTAQGFATMDLMLDVLVDPDLNWRWKDEDEFDALLERQLITTHQHHAIRAEAERVIERVERRLPPFNEPWPQWRPDPTWPTPTLPADWDVLDD